MFLTNTRKRIMTKVYYTYNSELKDVGAMALRKDQVLDVSALADMFRSPADRREFDLISPDTGIIVVSGYLRDALSPVHMKAIIAHEETHIELGHIHRLGAAGGSGIIGSMLDEIYADAGAAAKVGAVAVRKAIVATGMALIDLVCEDLGEHIRPAVRRQVKNALRPRVLALRAYK